MAVAEEASLVLMFAFVYVDLDKNDIRADLADAFPWNEKLKLPAKQSETLARPRHDQSLDPTAFGIKIQIHHTTEGSAVRNVYNLFVLQLT